MPSLQISYLYWVILFFSSLALVLIFSILLIVIYKKKLLKKRNAISSKLEDWLMDIILENNTEPNYIFPVPGEVQQLLQGKLAKKVLLYELMKLKKSLSGIAGGNLEKIYQQLNLQEISRKRLDSKHWHIKARGIQELAVMNQYAYLEQISALTNHKNNLVRLEAQISMVRLQDFKGLQFFDTLSYPLSDWHQVNLLYLLADQPIPEDEIAKWLKSSNASVIQFTLKLIGEQHASGFYSEVVKCLNDPHLIVRREAIICLGQIPSNEAALELTRHFAIETDKNLRLCIIHQLGKTASDLDTHFLQALQQDDDIDLKLAANKTVLYLQSI